MSFIDPSLWPKMHGGSTHLPIALTLAAALFDGLGFIWPATSQRKRTFLAAGYGCITLGALGTFPAVLSGLFMTKGQIMGHGALLFHHLFVWPAFASVVALGVWRFLIGENLAGRGYAHYLVVLLGAACLMATAGYWGGEMILNDEGNLPGEVVNLAPTQEHVTEDELVKQGHQFFVLSCAECHAADAHGDEGPDLHNLAISNGRIKNTILKGIKDEMPSFAQKYQESQINALTAYLRTLK